MISTDREGTNRPLLLAIMSSAGTYSEEVEARIRSRMAVISALAELRYRPEDAEHLGALQVPWPSASDFGPDWRTNSDRSFELAEPATNAFQCSQSLSVSFEWYHRSEFIPPSTTSPMSVLVVWLDEDRFGDNFELRLALLLKHIANFGRTNSPSATNAPISTSLVERVALVGPRTSEALR